MAEEKPKGKTPDDKTEETDKPKGKNKLMLIIIAAVSAILIILITIIIAVVLMNRPEPKPKPPQDEIGTLVPMRDFVVNLIDYGGRRYIKVKIELEVSNADVVEEITAKETILRNYIINILSSKTFNDIKAVEGKNALRKQIILKCNFILKKGKVLNVYFNDFIIQ